MKLDFNRALVVISLICAAIIAGLKYGMNFYDQGNYIWYALAFFVLLTWFSYHYTAQAKMEKNRFFTNRFFLTMGIRLILTILFLLIYLISNPQRDPIFVISFMLLYLFYTMFEINYLVSKLRREN